MQILKPSNLAIFILENAKNDEQMKHPHLEILQSWNLAIFTLQNSAKKKENDEHVRILKSWNLEVSKSCNFHALKLLQHMKNEKCKSWNREASRSWGICNKVKMQILKSCNLHTWIFWRSWKRVNAYLGILTPWNLAIFTP